MRRGFTLLELVVVIAVIAAIAAVVVPVISNFNQAAASDSDLRNVQTWNSVYRQALAADPAMPDSSWTEASNSLANGVCIGGVGEEYYYRAAIPGWSHKGEPEFVEGVGVISPPSGAE